MPQMGTGSNFLPYKELFLHSGDHFQLLLMPKGSQNLAKLHDGFHWQESEEKIDPHQKPKPTAESEWECENDGNAGGKISHNQ